MFLCFLSKLLTHGVTSESGWHQGQWFKLGPSDCFSEPFTERTHWHEVSGLNPVAQMGKQPRGPEHLQADSGGYEDLNVLNRRRQIFPLWAFLGLTLFCVFCSVAVSAARAG